MQLIDAYETKISGYNEFMLDRLLESVNNILTGHSFPTIPERIEDTYLIDSRERVRNPLGWPEDSKDKVVGRLFTFLRDRNQLPKPGYGCRYPTTWQYATIDSPEILYGDRIGRGFDTTIHYDPRTDEVTHLWKTLRVSPERAAKRAAQMELYERMNGKHPWFTFVREVPGGWTNKYVENQGNLKEYLQKGGRLTHEQTKQAVELLKQAQEHTDCNEAHGDLVKRPDFVGETAQFLRQREYDKLEPYGYLNFENILIDQDGNLVLVDYGGNADPSATGGYLDQPRSHDPNSQQFKEYELNFFQEGLDKIMEIQQQNPLFYLEQTLTMEQKDKLFGLTGHERVNMVNHLTESQQT